MPKRILIVEDEFVSRRLADGVFSQFGKCDHATSSAEALEAFELAHKEGEPYALISIDIVLPDMHGVALLRRLRKWEQDNDIARDLAAKVVMLTAISRDAGAEAAFKYDSDGYLEKPVTTKAVQAVLGRLGW